ncbi:MAG: alpha/beta hydrolase [Saprospiraceae bacterium]
MPHLETFHQTSDGEKLYLQAWEPETPRKGAVLIVHGLGEHSGRYAHFAAYLNQSGYAVYTFDGRGHGKSSLPSPTAYFASVEDYLKDIDDLFHKMKKYVEGVPCFIFGHSMGGGLVTQYVLNYQPALNGVLLSGSALLPGDDISPFLIKISTFMSKVAPKLRAVKLDSSHLSHDPEVMQKYNADELVYSKGIPARTGAELIAMMNTIQANMTKFDAPVLIMHGTEDHLTNIKGSEMLYEKASSIDKTLKLYEGFYHEILNEVEKETVMKDIVDWMNNRLTNA